jgi:hypothetical protein
MSIDFIGLYIWRQNVSRHFHFEKAWISTVPVIAEWGALCKGPVFARCVLLEIVFLILLIIKPFVETSFQLKAILSSSYMTRLRLPTVPWEDRFNYRKCQYQKHAEYPAVSVGHKLLSRTLPTNQWELPHMQAFNQRRCLPARSKINKGG